MLRNTTGLLEKNRIFIIQSNMIWSLSTRHRNRDGIKLTNQRKIIIHVVLVYFLYFAIYCMVNNDIIIYATIKIVYYRL